MPKSAGPFGIEHMDGYNLFVITLLAHIAFGAVLGILVQRWKKHKSSILGLGKEEIKGWKRSKLAVIVLRIHAGATTLSFLYEYEIPIRLITIGVLVITYFLMVELISTECKVKMKTEKR